MLGRISVILIRSSKIDLYLALNNLRAVLFNDQLLLSGKLRVFMCRSDTRCVVFDLAYMYVKVTYPLSWEIVNNFYIVYSVVPSFRPAQESTSSRPNLH